MSVAVLDANVLIDVLREVPGAVALWDRLADEDEVAAPTTTRAEVLAGMKPDEHEATHELLDLVSWVPVSIEIADAAAAYARQYQTAHSGIDLADFILAATADILKAHLLTLNVRHFPMFPELEPPY